MGGSSDAGTSAMARSISDRVRSANARPDPGTPSAAAIASIWSSTVSRVRSGSRNTTGMPASRSCSCTARGPMLVSVRITVGDRARMASALSECPPGVTLGMSAAAGKLVAVSRPTRLSPRPRAKIVSPMVPFWSTATMRLASVIVTGTPSADSTVTGKTGLCGASTGVGSRSSRTAVAGPGPLVGSGAVDAHAVAAIPTASRRTAAATASRTPRERVPWVIRRPASVRPRRRARQRRSC